jgi:hypothetical protein
MRRSKDVLIINAVSVSGKREIERDSSQAGGYRVRVGVRAGAWQCNSCSGKTMGSQLFKAHCGYCIKE